MTTSRLAACLSGILLVGACRGPGGGQSLKGITLPNLDRSQTVSLGACPTDRCLTVYVAPWCGYCRRATPMFRDLRKLLDSRGMASRIVVGLDEEGPLVEYAREFGGDTLLDPSGSLSPSGVPHLYVSDAAGRVLRHVAGAPPTLESAAQWALQ